MISCTRESATSNLNNTTNTSNRGQYILLNINNTLPTGATARGGGYAEVENGRGQYILLNINNTLPTGATARGGGYAEVVE